MDDVFNKCSTHDGFYGVYRSHRSDELHALSFVQFLEALRQLAAHCAQAPAAAGAGTTQVQFYGPSVCVTLNAVELLVKCLSQACILACA